MVLNINDVFRQLAEYTRIKEEAEAVIDGLKDDIKKYMDSEGVDVLTGNEHKATYNIVTSSRVDTTALKKQRPDIAAAFTVSTSSKRFTFK